MRRRAVTVALMLALLALGGTAAAAQASPGHAGRWITDSRGRVWILHGLNMVYKVPPYYPQAAGFGSDDAAFLQRNGFNLVRVGVIWKALEPSPGVYDDAYLNHIAATVAALWRHGILSLLDFHQDLYNERFQGEGAPDWAVQDDGLPALPRTGFPDNYVSMPALQHAFDHFWANSPGPAGVGLQARFAAAWRHVALRFRAVPGVLGYELMNEPFPGTVYATCLAGCPLFDAKLTAFNRRVASAIRTVDRRTLIFYEPNVLFNFGAPTDTGALDDRTAGFSWHDYCFTPGCNTRPLTMQNAARHVAETGEATLMSEFGSTTSAADLEYMVGLADRNMVPWAEWAYCGCNDPTGAIPPSAEAVVLDPHRPPFGSNVVWTTLRALVEPYPQLVSGTPLGWGFDPASELFRLRYSTGRASGHGRFRSGALTLVAVPALVYHGHYRVDARGAAVVSARGASLLALAACPGARTISVVVSRHGRQHVSCHR